MKSLLVLLGTAMVPFGIALFGDAFLLRIVKSWVRWWVRAITMPLPPELRDCRRAEIESDVWEQTTSGQKDGYQPKAIAAHIFARWIIGVPDDCSWACLALQARAWQQLKSGDRLAQMRTVLIPIISSVVAVTWTHGAWGLPLLIVSVSTALCLCVAMTLTRALLLLARFPRQPR